MLLRLSRSHNLHNTRADAHHGLAVPRGSGQGVFIFGLIRLQESLFMEVTGPHLQYAVPIELPHKIFIYGIYLCRVYLWKSRDRTCNTPYQSSSPKQ